MTVPISAALKAHFALSGGASQTVCSILRVERRDGQVFGFTEHDSDITYDDGDGSVVYSASLSYVAKDVSNQDDLSVDNTEYEGIATSDSITEDDLLARKWDYADVRLSIINWADTSQGALRLIGWKLGQIVLRRDRFVAEIRGILQAYSQTIGELTQPGCRANLGDARCKVDLTAFTVTGTLTGVSADQMTLFDTSRAEAGPATALAITNVSNSNPGHVTLSTGLGAQLSEGQSITIAGIVGPDVLNGNTIVRNLSGDVFDLGVNTTNTSDYPPYVSGGTVTPLGGDSGYFDFGIITMTSGDALDESADVLSYVPGQWTLQIPFDHDVAIGDTYTMVAGCDKSLSTCINRFSNAANMRGEPFLPGIDDIMQVGKQ